MARVVLSEAARQLLDSDAVASVVTIDEDGGPQVTAAWVGLEGDEIVLATMPDQRKIRNLRRDPRIALSVPSTRRTPGGCSNTSWSTGGRVTEGGAAETLQRLAHTYLGPDVVFPNMPDPPPGFVTRITPQRLGGVGPWNPPDIRSEFGRTLRVTASKLTRELSSSTADPTARPSARARSTAEAVAVFVCCLLERIDPDRREMRTRLRGDLDRLCRAGTSSRARGSAIRPGIARARRRACARTPPA